MEVDQKFIFTHDTLVSGQVEVTRSKEQLDKFQTNRTDLMT